MNEIKENLNDTKYLLDDSEYKNINLEEYSVYKNNDFNNTQLLLEDKSEILEDNNNYNEGGLNQENPSNNNINNNIDSKNNIDNSIKDIMINNNINIEKEKAKDEQEIIKQQNILLNNQSSHLEELFSLSYTDLSHNNNNNPTLKIPPMNIIAKEKTINENNINIINNKNNQNINDENNNIKKIYFGTLFPTQQIIKNISYKNDNNKKIICFKIGQNKKDNYSEFFKLLIDKNKTYFNIKSNEEIHIKVLLEIPFIKNKKQINCELYIIDINNNLIDSFYLYVNVEIPKLCCLRYKNILKESHIPLILIKVGFKENQKFRIPFKNLAIKDLKIDFNLLSSPKNEDNINEYISYEIIFDVEKNFLIPSFDVNYLEMLINIKNKKKLDIKDNSNYLKIKKIIQAKIFGTKISYYFCLELIINENNENEKILENI